MCNCHTGIPAVLVFDVITYSFALKLTLPVAIVTTGGAMLSPLTFAFNSVIVSR